MSLARYTSFAVGSGLSTSLSFACSFVMIRNLSPAEFGVANLTFTAAITVALTSSGLDLAYMRSQGVLDHRQTARGQYIRYKVIVYFVSIVVAASVLAVTSEASYAMETVVALSFFSVGYCGVSIRLAEAQALGDIRAYALVQLAPYVVWLVSLAAFAQDGLSLEEALSSLAVAGVPGIVLLGLALVRIRSTPSLSDRSRAFLAMSVALTASTALTALFERIDVLAASALLASGEFGVYSAGVRIAGGFAVLTSAFVAYAMQASSQASHVGQLKALYVSLAAPLLAITLLASAAAVTSLLALTVVLGRAYVGSETVAAIYVLQYPLVAAYMPAVIALTHFGRKRWQVEMAALLVSAKLLAVLLLPADPTALSVSAVAAHAAAIVYLAARIHQVRRTAALVVDDYTV